MSGGLKWTVRGKEPPGVGVPGGAEKAIGPAQGTGAAPACDAAWSGLPIAYDAPASASTMSNPRSIDTLVADI